MRAPCWLVVRALVVPLLLGVAASVSAQGLEAGSVTISEGIDDPKLERRLGTRVELLVGAPPASEVAAQTAPATPAVIAKPVPKVPHLKLGFRRFEFAQVGATAMSGAGPAEPFDVVSLDFYPVSSSWRLGLSTQYGWQEGKFQANGDAFITEAVSLGGQIPGPRFTPFAEAFAGGGYMQRTHAGLSLDSVATIYGQLGFDVGTELFLARYAFVSAAIGYIHASNAFVKGAGAEAAFGSVSVDTWSFKLGFGL